VEVYMVGAEIKEINMEQQEASATTLTGPPDTENDVDVDIAKETTLATNTEALKIETTNKFEKIKSLRSAPTLNLSKNVDVKTDAKAQVEKAAKTALYA
jgi:hypothetical protein